MFDVHSLKPQLAALCFILLCALAGRAMPQNVVAAKLAFADRETRYQKDEWPYIYYLDVEPSVGEERDDLLTAIKLVVCSAASPQQSVLERMRPTQLGDSSLYRMDLRELGWDYDDWKTVLSKNPYFEGGFTAVIRADWLLLQLSDMTESDAYLRLMFGSDEKGNIVTTRDQVLAKLGVSNQREHVFGLIEGQSGVAKQGTRWIENRPMIRGYAYGTRDASELTLEKDPLEHPDGSQAHDAEEWIFGLPLTSETGARGARQAYLLTNGQGLIQNEAPVNIVEDTTEFRGHRNIINPGGCIQCHGANGLNPFTSNEFRAQIQQGVVPFTDDPSVARDLQAFHLSDLGKEIARNNEDYQLMTKLITGKESADVAAAFKRAINRYDAPLDLTHAAEEFVPYGWTAQDVTAALETAANTGQAGARLAGLTRGRTIPREAWEQQFLKTFQSVKQHVKVQEQ